MGWSRQLDEEEIEDLVASFQPSSSKVEVYAYDRDGWKLSDRVAAADATYHDFTKEARWPEDKAAAARAVACVDLRL
jgi:hypothetical protein